QVTVMPGCGIHLLLRVHLILTRTRPRMLLVPLRDVFLACRFRPRPNGIVLTCLKRRLRPEGQGCSGPQSCRRAFAANKHGSLFSVEGEDFVLLLVFLVATKKQ